MKELKKPIKFFLSLLFLAALGVIFLNSIIQLNKERDRFLINLD